MRAAIRAAGLALGYTGLLSLVRDKGRQGGGKLLVLIPAAGVRLLAIWFAYLYGLRGRGGEEVVFGYIPTT